MLTCLLVPGQLFIAIAALCKYHAVEFLACIGKHAEPQVWIEVGVHHGFGHKILDSLIGLFASISPFGQLTQLEPLGAIRCESNTQGPYQLPGQSGI